MNLGWSQAIQNWKVEYFASAPLEIIDGDRGRNYPKNEEFTSDGYCLFLNANNVTSSGFSFANNLFISQERDEKLRQGKLVRSDIILTTRGTLGNVGFYSEKIIYEHLRINSGMVIIRVEKTHLVPEFIYYYLRSPQFKNQVNSLRSGAAQPQLPVRDIKRITIPIPSLQIQGRIASILSAYDDLIENNNRRIALLEESMRLLYREWFVHLRFPGHEHVRVVDGLPEGWTKGVFTDFIEVLSGGTPKTSISEYWGGDIPWFTPQDLTGEFYVLDTLRKITELGLSKCASKLYPRQTVFITARGTVGKCVLASVPMAMSQTNYALLGKNNLSQFYVFLLTLSLVSELQKQATGAVFDTIIVDTFRKMPVIIPPNNLVERFSDLCQSSFLMIENLQKSNKTLSTARDLLLPRLMSGEITMF